MNSTTEFAASVRGWREGDGDPLVFLLAFISTKYPDQSPSFVRGVLAAYLAEEESPYGTNASARPH